MAVLKYNDDSPLFIIKRNSSKHFMVFLCTVTFIGCCIILSIICYGFFIANYDLSTISTKGQRKSTVYTIHNIKFTEKKLNNDKVISCYYNPPSNFSDRSELLPDAIHPHLCTHINVAFAEVVNKTIHLSDNLKKTVKDILQLKKINPNLKILLSIGGAGERNGFSEMIIDHASRKIFIKSIKAFLKEFKLDGVDLDWEFPAVHNSELHNGHSRERQHFSQLLREIRKEYEREKHNFLLTIAAGAPEIIVDNAYDVDQLNVYTDYVNIMTYDFHFYSRATPFTGLNSPLYPRQEEFGYLATLNINSTINMYIGKGLSPEKIVIGVPTYGHSYTLVNPDNHQIGSPASGYGKLGSLGFVDYLGICKYMQEYSKEVVIETEKSAKVPYLYKGKEWVSFESQESVMEKAKLIKDYGLRGAMIYSLNSDDYLGVCQLHGNEKFPLSQSVRDTFQTRQELIISA